jgi:Fe-S oxidoreductase
MELKYAFAPGCALMIYKSDLASEVHEYLNMRFGKMDMYLTCCRHKPPEDTNLRIINVCPGCDKRFGSLYPGVSTVSLWEVIAGDNAFEFPDYNGLKMAIVDACPVRDNPKVHDSVRQLLRKMNIGISEPEKSREKSICCGDSFYGDIPVGKVKIHMKKRASQMPENYVVVYCISCTKSMFIGGKKPRYLVDLLFNKPTEKKTLDLDEWHAEVDAYIEKH